MDLLTLLAEATPGEWRVENGVSHLEVRAPHQTDRSIARVYCDIDAELICRAINYLRRIPMTENFNFDSLEPQKVPVRYKGADYVLREATAGAVKRYEGARLQAMRLSDEGKISGFSETMTDADIVLVAECLKIVPSANNKGELPEESGWKSVVPQVVRGWPNRVVEPLVKAVKAMSGIDEDTEESLTKAIEVAQRRLVELRKRRAATRTGEETETAPKGGLDSTTVSSE